MMSRAGAMIIIMIIIIMIPIRSLSALFKRPAQPHAAASGGSFERRRRSGPARSS